MKKEQPERKEEKTQVKQKYNAPRLKVHGDLAEITQGSTTSGIDPTSSVP